MEKGFIHKLAIICKDYYVNRTIDDLFVSSGAEQEWWISSEQSSNSARIDNFNGWISGIQKHAPQRLELILSKVTAQISVNDQVPIGEREYIAKELESLRRENVNENTVFDVESVLNTSARLFAGKGEAREVAILAHAVSKLVVTDHGRDFDGEEYTVYVLYLQLPSYIYSQIADVKHESEENILQVVKMLVSSFPNEFVRNIVITPLLEKNDAWRDRAKAWVAGSGISNQGRVRSENVASKAADGLLFRSEPEIHLYRALKALGVSFAPLPVFVKGGDTYRRIEPDFVILKDGIVLIIEVDGDTVHQETPAEAHNRITMLIHEGAHLERVKASECSSPERAKSCAQKLLNIISKIKSTR